MARGRSRPERRPGRQERESVVARVTDDVVDDLWRRGDDPDDPPGSAGVREPRRPLPQPLSGAGQAPIPAPPLVATLPDPRY